MKHRHLQHHDRSASNDALVSEEIDRLYGLEPVIDIDAPMNEVAEGTQYVTVACPYCGESFDTRIDMTGGSFEYVEDCQICCQPITLKVELNDAGDLINVSALQLNE